MVAPSATSGQRSTPHMLGSRARSLVLGVALLTFRTLTLPFVVFYLLSGRSANAFAGIMQVACLAPASPGVFLRQALLRWMARRCGRRVTTHVGTLFSHPGVEIGENVYIGAFCNIGYARIADDVLLGSGVHVLSGKHQHAFDRQDIPIAQQGGMKTPVHLGTGAWLGNGAIVMADVGEHSIIGAGSVVVTPVPAWSIAAGSPARVIADRRRSTDKQSSEGHGKA